MVRTAGCRHLLLGLLTIAQVLKFSSRNRAINMIMESDSIPVFVSYTFNTMIPTPCNFPRKPMPPIRSYQSKLQNLPKLILDSLPKVCSSLAGMQIVVMLPDDKSIYLEVQLTDTIHKVKAKIQEKKQIPLQNQILLRRRNFEVLKDEATVAQCHIKQGSNALILLPGNKKKENKLCQKQGELSQMRRKQHLKKQSKLASKNQNKPSQRDESWRSMFEGGEGSIRTRCLPHRPGGLLNFVGNLFGNTVGTWFRKLLGRSFGPRRRFYCTLCGDLIN